VPYEVDGAKTATIQTIVGGVASETWTVPVAAAAPGIFTSGSSGTGFAAALNQDGTINNASNPATRGTVVSLFATGGGQTQPAGVTGTLAGSSGASPKLPVSAKIGGQNANVLYAGAAPGLISGVMQLNVAIPVEIGSGTASLTIQVGDSSSQVVSIAVR
jgi:uncharacterized protein (TIGR03437 family)